MMLSVFNCIGQQSHDFYVQLNPTYNFKKIKTHSKNNHLLKIKTDSKDFNKFLKNYQITEFKRAFSDAKTDKLKQILFISLVDSSAIDDFLNRKEIENVISYNKDLKGDYPSDYYDEDGQPNTALELIKAPQAWTITHGDSTLVIGVCDREYDKNNADLKGKIIKDIKLSRPSRQDHGTSVAAVIAANTNDGKGIPGVGYNTKLTVVSGTYSLLDGLDSLSKVPGMKVINCSWSICNPNERRMKKIDSIVKKVQERGVLIVESAGNGAAQPCRLNAKDKYNGYRYPASFDYDNIVCVTSVGHKFPVGTNDKKYGRGAWKDCHQNIPRMGENDPKTTHTHNDRVDICAPGWHVKVPIRDNKFKNANGTSISAPFVTGVAALMYAVNRDLTPAIAKDILKSTADDIYHIKYNQQFKGQLGAGRVNAYKAVLIAKLLNDDASHNPQ